MIFYGTRSTKIKEKRLADNTQCPNCNSQNSFNVTIYGKYFHIYWIPLIPLGKPTVLECSNCKKTYYDSELPESIQAKLKRSNEIDPAKRPIGKTYFCIL